MFSSKWKWTVKTSHKCHHLQLPVTWYKSGIVGNLITLWEKKQKKWAKCSKTDYKVTKLNLIWDLEPLISNPTEHSKNSSEFNHLVFLFNTFTDLLKASHHRSISISCLNVARDCKLANCFTRDSAIKQPSVSLCRKSLSRSMQKRHDQSCGGLPMKLRWCKLLLVRCMSAQDKQSH